MPVTLPVEMTRDLPVLGPRPVDAHKGDFGRVLVVAGSRGMAGAAILAGRAALRGGAGLVRLAVPGAILDTVASGHPCYMTAPLDQDEAGRLGPGAEGPLLALAQASDVLVVGPGLGHTPAITRLVTALACQTDRPMVLDADALNSLVGQSDCLRGRRGIVITPHPGEFARLLGSSTSAVQADRLNLAIRFAADHGIVVLLKGHRTVVTDGVRAYVNPNGNPGMATGGTGDVLSGLIGSLLGQGLTPFDGARLGAFVHGLAGDLARDRLGEVSLLATDIIENLPQAFLALPRAGERVP